MAKDIQVVIVEDDPFSRNWMTLLVARDWRTRVVADYDRPEMLSVCFKENPALQVDIIVVDTETPLGGNWVEVASKAVTDANQSARILCTGIVANERILRKLEDPLFVGYVLKGEIPYSLGWAINLAMQGKWVTTSDVYKLASQIGFPKLNSCVVLDGHQSPFKIIDKQKAREARLAILFSMERHEFADELGIVTGWSYGKVKEYYSEMGLKDMLFGEGNIEDNLKGENLILSYLDEMKKEYSGSGKHKWMETMAFHLLTMPKVIQRED